MEGRSLSDFKTQIIAVDRSDRKLETLEDVDFLNDKLVSLRLDLNLLRCLKKIPKSLKILNVSCN